MKRLWILVLTLCVTALFCVGTLGLGAAETNTGLWNVYSSYEADDGRPVFLTPPEHTYTDEGLWVIPSEDVYTYTVQTDRAYSTDDGIYMEIKTGVSEAQTDLFFHLWSQSAVIPNNYRCGSGWQGHLRYSEDGSHYMISLSIQGADSADGKGSSNILGIQKVNAPIESDGTVTFTLWFRDGTLLINGDPVDGMDNVLAALRKENPDGRAHVSATILMPDKDAAVPMTVTRFGTSPETATVPGTGVGLPDTETTPDETRPPKPTETNPPVTEAPKPTETDPPAENTTAAPSPDTEPEQDGETTPAADPEKPTESDALSSETEFDPFLDPADTTPSDYIPPFGEHATETRREIRDEAVDNFVNKLEGCVSALSMGTVGLTAILAAYVCLRKKNQTEE